MVTFWPRINTILLLVTLLTVIGLFATRAFGGPLDPPAAPTSTPGGIDGRIPISSLPFTISSPGSYILTRNLQLADAEGITVNADSVAIDLNGFTLDGVTKNASGIEADGRSHLSVVNGTIRGWNIGINNDPISGNELNASFHGLEIDDNTYGLFVSRNARLDASIITRSTAAGIVGNGPGITITNSTFSNNAIAIVSNSQDNLIESNHIEVPSGGTGIQAGDFTTVRHNFFGNPSLTGYVTIALGTSNYVVVIENRMKASLTTGGSGAGVYIPYDVNNALTNLSP